MFKEEKHSKIYRVWGSLLRLLDTAIGTTNDVHMRYCDKIKPGYIFVVATATATATDNATKPHVAGYRS